MKRETIEEAITNIDDRYVEEAANYQAAQSVSPQNANMQSVSPQAANVQAAPAKKKGTVLQFFRRHYALTTVACLALAVLVVFSVTRVSDRAATESMRTAGNSYDGAYYYGGDDYEFEPAEMPADMDFAESIRETGAASGSKGMVSSNSVTGTNPLIGENSKIIYNATITAESTDYENAVAGLEALVSANGGYFEVADEYDRGSGYRSASFTIRIPAEAFEGVTNGIQDLCHVTRNSVRKTDISETYYDTQSRLESAKAKLDRLRELMDQAESMEDIITLEDAINMAQYDVDYYSGQMKHYDSQVAYSTITMTLEEVYKETEVSAPLTFWDRLGDSFSEGMSSFGEFWEDFALWLVYNWTFLLFVAAIAVCIILIVRHRKRKKAKKSQENANNA